MKLSWTRPSLAIVGIGAVATALGGPFLSSLGTLAVLFGLLSILRVSETDARRLLAMHWRLFNMMLRVMGLGFTFTGLVFLAWEIYFYAVPTSELNDTEPWRAFVGVLLLARRGYRPDLGDQALSDRTRRWLAIYPAAYLPEPIEPDKSARRSWWTGDRLPRR